MNRFLQGWEGVALWCLFVPLPWLLFAFGWEASLQREEAALQRGVRDALQTETDHFRTDLRGIDFLQRCIDRVAERFGFTDHTAPTILGADPASFPAEALQPLLASLREETGTTPFALVLAGPGGQPCHAWIAPGESLGPEPDRGQRRLEELLASFFRDYQPIRGRSSPNWELKHRLRRKSTALFGPEALIDDISSWQTSTFVSHHHEHGFGYWTFRQAGPLFATQEHPRQASFFVVFHHRDLKPEPMAAQAITRAATGFRRRLAWLPPSTLPRFEEGPDRLAYLDPLSEIDFRRLLERDQAARFATGYRPVLVAEADPSWWRSPRRAWHPYLQTGFALAAGLITLILFRGTWMGGTFPGGLGANLAGGFAVCLGPWVAGVVLLTQAWLDIRAQGLPAESVDFLERHLDLVDQRIAYARDLEDRRLARLRPIFLRILNPADREARDRLAQVAASTTVDFAFLFDRSRIVHQCIEGQPTGRDLVTLFKGFAFAALKEATEACKPTGSTVSPSDLLWRTLVDQLLDMATLGRAMANESRLQRSPFGNPEQTLQIFFLRRQPDPAPPVAMAVTMGGISFVEHLLEIPLRNRTLMARQTPSGFSTDVFLYKYPSLVIPGIQPLSHCHPDDRSLWERFRPLAEATRRDFVGKVLRNSNDQEGTRWAVSRPCQADYFIAVGTAIDQIDRGLERQILLGSVTITLALLLLGLVSATSFFLVRPLGAFLTAARRAARGDFSWHLALSLRDEFQTMAGVFNLMAERLTERQRLSRFVSEDTLSAIEKAEEEALRRGGSEITTTVLVSDIRGFTSLTEVHPPEAIVDLLNDYFTAMETCITDQQGVIVSFIGDAILAHFPADSNRRDPPAARAIAAARAMRGALATLNRERETRGLFQIATGIGLATGPTWSGVIGSQIGRLAQTILGETVDRATTLESSTKLTGGSGILADHATVQEAGLIARFVEQPAAGGWELVDG